MQDKEYIVPYQDIRDGASIRVSYGSVSIPNDYQRLEFNSLSKEAQLIVSIAESIYKEWLLSSVIIRDEQSRLLLTFKANIPQEAVTLRINLGKLSNELAKGLSPEILRTHLNILK